MSHEGRMRRGEKWTRLMNQEVESDKWKMADVNYYNFMKDKTEAEVTELLKEIESKNSKQLKDYIDSKTEAPVEAPVEAPAEEVV